MTDTPHAAQEFLAVLEETERLCAMQPESLRRQAAAFFRCEPDEPSAMLPYIGNTPHDLISRGPAECQICHACCPFCYPTPEGQTITAARELRRIVEEIYGAMIHGTWRDENGFRLKDTPAWVALYLALAAADERGAPRDEPAAPADAPVADQSGGVALILAAIEQLDRAALKGGAA